MNQTAIKKLLFESACIILIAAVVGVIWNHKLLYRAWTGQAAPPAVPAGQAVPAGATPLPVGLMQVKDFYDRKEAVLVDARDAASFTQARISGAVSLPVGEASQKLPAFKAKFPADTLLMIYCNGYGCHDSMELGQKLIEAGYASVFVFEGGYPEWKDAGYPVEGTSP